MDLPRRSQPPYRARADELPLVPRGKHLLMTVVVKTLCLTRRRFGMLDRDETSLLLLHDHLDCWGGCGGSLGGGERGVAMVIYVNWKARPPWLAP